MPYPIDATPESSWRQRAERWTEAGERKIPGARWLRTSLRTLHLIAVGALYGGHLYAVDVTRLRPALLSVLLERAAKQPVLFVVEDLHWIDPSTLELLDLILDQGPTARILTVLTFRPTFQPPWALRSHLTPIALGPLPAPDTRAMVKGVTGGKPLPEAVVEQVVAKTDGIPLFVEELTKTVLESDWLREQDDRYELTGPLPPLAIPATLQDSLMARLDRLATGKEVAQLGPGEMVGDMSLLDSRPPNATASAASAPIKSSIPPVIALRPPVISRRAPASPSTIVTVSSMTAVPSSPRPSGFTAGLASPCIV